MFKDAEDYFRLCLMENPEFGQIQIRAWILDQTGERLSGAELSFFWGKYRGWDGRTRPTHDVETGDPLPR